MVDLIKTLSTQISGGFLAANAACAKHCHRWLALEHTTWLLLLFYPLGKITKTVCLRVNGPLKSPNTYLIIIACINNYYVRAANQCIPLLRRYILADPFGGR